MSERFFFARVVCYNVRNHSEAGENKDIYFRMAKESKEMLVKNGVPAPCWVEEGGVKVAVC